jgi:RNA polymerase sigma-70 factor (ECF subfamily)
VTSALKRGRATVARQFQPGLTVQLVPTRANGHPAFGMYIREPAATSARANGVMVFTFAGSGICAMTRFDTSVLPRFGLPAIL